MNGYRNVRVSSVSLGISGGEDGVNKNKGANNLSSKAITLGVSMAHKIRSTFEQLIPCIPLKPLDHTSTTDSSKTLHHNVEHGSRQGQLPSQKQTERHCRIYVPTCPNNNSNIHNFKQQQNLI